MTTYSSEHPRYIYTSLERKILRFLGHWFAPSFTTAPKFGAFLKTSNITSIAINILWNIIKIPSGRYHVVAPLQGCYPGREIPTPAECAAASQVLGLRFSRAYTSPRYARNCWANFANGAYFNYLQGRAPHTDGATREICCARESSFRWADNISLYFLFFRWADVNVFHLCWN